MQRILSSIITLFIGLVIISISLLGFVFLNPEANSNNDNTNNNHNPIPDNHQWINDSFSVNLNFNGTRAWEHLKNQIDIGYRTPGSPELEKTRQYIVEHLKKHEWIVEFHNFTYQGVESTNILAFPHNTTTDNLILLGAHYDTRWEASRDPLPSNRDKPILGANDAASGVAILLEYAEIYFNRTDIALLFIDAEDQGGIDDWDYIAGSTEFAKESVFDNYFLNGKDSINAFILFDMVADWNLNIHKEGNSDPILLNEIWLSASELNYSIYFIDSYKYTMIDDHVPFKNAGIPSVDLIDFDYDDENGNNLHHTINDNLNYVSESSLWIVGQTIDHWLKNFYFSD